MPPAAASTGAARRRGSDSSPFRISCLISRPTIRKNRAIKPSLTQSDRVRLMVKSPTLIGKYVLRAAK